MVTIKDIAEKSGFSRGTVDRVLHGRAGVQENTKKEIKRIAEEMGYQANAAGVLLSARKKPTTIGCLLPDIGNDFFLDVMKGMSDAESALSCYGVKLLVKHLQGFDEADHLKALQALVDEGASALLLTTMDSDAMRKAIDSLSLPVACMNTDVPSSRRLFFVGCDSYASGCTAAGMLSLMASSPLSVLLFTGSCGFSSHNERIKGFLDTLRQPYVIVEQDEVLDDTEVAYRRAKEALLHHEEANAVFVVAGGASGVCRAIVETRGAQRPHVVTFDATEENLSYLQQGVIDATVTQMPYEQGYQGVKRLFEAVVEKDGSDRSLLLPPTIVIKENAG